MLAIGLMSGTSLDGVDAVLVDIEGYGINTLVKVIDFMEYPMSQPIRDKIHIACNEEQSSVDLICSLNFELGFLFSKSVSALLEKAGVTSDQISFIASHGQTIYHIAKNQSSLLASSLQIGEPAVIAYQHNTTVISNFRTMDMASGGQGAPLVPYSEWILYSQKDKNIALQNLGGIGNVTVLNKSLKIEDVFAFDTGPGNMMINEACRVLFHCPYDQGGHIASKGNCIDALLATLMQHSYLQEKPPKSTGREEFGEVYVQKLIQAYVDSNPYDIVATFTMYTALTMKDQYNRYILNSMDIDEIIIGGGGSHNQTLMKYIKDVFYPIPIFTQEDKGYSSDAKEAIAFAILGNETMHHQASNVKSATGASDHVILGNITLAPIGGN